VGQNHYDALKLQAKLKLRNLFQKRLQVEDLKGPKAVFASLTKSSRFIFGVFYIFK